MLPATQTPQPLNLLQGDVDCNGEANSIDALLIFLAVGGSAFDGEPDCPEIGALVDGVFGDLNCDGEVTAADVALLMRYLGELSVDVAGNCTEIGEPL